MCSLSDAFIRFIRIITLKSIKFVILTQKSNFLTLTFELNIESNVSFFQELFFIEFIKIYAVLSVVIVKETF